MKMIIHQVLIAIALTAIVAISASTLPEASQPAEIAPKSAPEPAAAAAKPIEIEAKKEPTIEAKKEAEQAPKSDQIAPKSAEAPKPEPVAQAEPKVDNAADAGKRKARADSSSPAPAEAPKAAPEQKSADQKPAEKEKPAESKPTAAPSKPESTLAGKSNKAQPKPATNKSKLLANLGTVTSTGSGGPSHYMSKHDAYSAIAEKHGSLTSHAHSSASSSMKKADKRKFQGFSGGIQKASGFGDILSPFKGVTDSGLARTLGASMRSIMKGKYSVPAYVASALLGAVALMAFYESPISPLPVPPLPEPPVGRFPPEMPSLPVGTQVPFRPNQQNQQQYGQNYNSRSLNIPQMMPGATGQQPQVFFPGNTAGGANSQKGPNPVQMAADFLTGKQAAQRKSGSDFDPTMTRALFGAAVNNLPRMSAMAMQAPAQSKTGSFLSMFGLGGGPSAGNQEIAQASSMGATNAPVNEPKMANQNSNMSGSHVVNKVRSIFNRSSGSATAPASGSGNIVNKASTLEQYQKMSLIQALMKDTSFITSLLTPNRKSSQQASQSPAASVQSSPSSSPGNGPAARMQDEAIKSEQSAGKQQQKQSSYSLAKAADSIAHALLESFASNVMQRSAPQSNQQVDNMSRKSGEDQSNAQISDIITNYSAGSQSQPQASPKQSDAPSEDDSKSSAVSQKSADSSSAPSTSSVDAGHQSSSSSAVASAAAPQQAAAHIRKMRSVGFEYPTYEVPAQSPSRAAQINNIIDYVTDTYDHNKFLVNLVMDYVGLGRAVPYLDRV